MINNQLILNKYLDDHFGFSSEQDKNNYRSLLSFYIEIISILDKNSSQDFKKCFNALPFKPSLLNIDTILNALANLGFIYKKHIISVKNISSMNTPWLVLINTDILLVNKTEDGLVTFDANIHAYHKLTLPENTKIVVYEFMKISNIECDLSYESCQFKAISWFSALVNRFKKIIYQFLFISFILHILSLALPIYIMSIYDKVINAHQLNAIVPITIGVLFVLVCENYLKHLRASAISDISSRIDYLVNTNIVEKLLQYPAAFFEKIPVISQIARIKSFSSIRDFFSGPIFIACIEMPFSIIMLIFIGVINIYLMLIPVISILVFCIFILSFYNITKSEINQTAECFTKQQKILTEFVENIFNIHHSGLLSHYRKELHSIGALTSFHEYHSMFIASIIDSIGRAISLVTGLMMLIIGVQLIWTDQLTVGGLIASIFLVWRILTPLQNIASSMSRVEKLKKGIVQVNTFMQTKPEVKEDAINLKHTKIQGNIKFNNVGLRHDNQSQLTLRNLSFNIKNGEFVIVTGGNGSGKSSLLKLINGTLHPSIGSIYIDNVNIKQYNLEKLRSQILYIPHSPNIFTASIKDNVSLFNPMLTDEQICEALEKVNAMDEILTLKLGENTQINNDSTKLSASLMYKISLARLYVNNTPIILIDNLPNIILDDKCGNEFKNYIHSCKGNKTILLVSYRTDFIEFSDQIINLSANIINIPGMKL